MFSTNFGDTAGSTSEENSNVFYLI